MSALGAVGHGWRVLAAVCPVAPSAEIQKSADTWTANARWAVIALLGFIFLVCLIFMLVGFGFRNHRLVQAGAGGLALVVIAAILLVGFTGVLKGTVGSGCADSILPSPGASATAPS